jgi:hypothetical protein
VRGTVTAQLISQIVIICISHIKLLLMLIFFILSLILSFNICMITYLKVVVVLLKVVSNPLVVIVTVDHFKILQVELIILWSILSIVGAHYYLNFKLIILIY